MRVADMEITLKIIELVKKYEIIYNTKHPHYRDKVKRAMTWEIIAKQLNIPVLLLKSKWRNIRDGYTKHLRTLGAKRELANKNYVKWPWSAYMEFFKPYAYSHGPRLRRSSPTSQSQWAGCNSANDDSEFNVEFNDSSSRGGSVSGNNTGKIFIKSDFDDADDGASYGDNENSTNNNDNGGVEFDDFGNNSTDPISVPVDQQQSNENSGNIDTLPLQLEIEDCRSVIENRRPLKRRLAQDNGNAFNNNFTDDTDPDADVSGMGYGNDSKRRTTFQTDPFGASATSSYPSMMNADLDATELLFLAYAKTVKTFSPRRQVMTKMKINQIIAEEELQHLEEFN